MTAIIHSDNPKTFIEIMKGRIRTQPDQFDIEAEKCLDDLHRSILSNKIVVSHSTNPITDGASAKNKSEQEFLCSMCHHMFASATFLRNHISHRHRSYYDCKLCEQKFSDISDLRSHWKVHDVADFVECEICFKVFKNIPNLTKHKRIVHNRAFKESTLEKNDESKRNVQCKICNLSYSDSTDLRKHLQTHVQEKGYKCPCCKREFFLRSSLDNHMKVHSSFGVNPTVSELVSENEVNKNSKKCQNCMTLFVDSVELSSHKCPAQVNSPTENDISRDTFVIDDNSDDNELVKEKSNKSTTIEDTINRVIKGLFQSDICTDKSEKPLNLTKNHTTKEVDNVLADGINKKVSEKDIAESPVVEDIPLSKDMGVSDKDSSINNPEKSTEDVTDSAENPMEVSSEGKGNHDDLACAINEDSSSTMLKEPNINCNMNSGEAVENEKSVMNVEVLQHINVLSDERIKESDNSTSIMDCEVAKETKIQTETVTDKMDCDVVDNSNESKELLENSASVSSETKIQTETVTDKMDCDVVDNSNESKEILENSASVSSENGE